MVTFELGKTIGNTRHGLGLQGFGPIPNTLYWAGPVDGRCRRIVIGHDLLSAGGAAVDILRTELAVLACRVLPALHGITVLGAGGTEGPWANGEVRLPIPLLPGHDIHAIPALRCGMGEHRIEVDALYMVPKIVPGEQPCWPHGPHASFYHILQDDQFVAVVLRPAQGIEHRTARPLL